jgi:starvation-inducible DNA-binding protein
VVSTGISRDTVSSFFMVNSRICTTTLPRRLAERILMLGGEPENKFSEYLKVARVKEVSGVSCGDEALKNILDTYGHLIDEERKLLSLASGAGDEATVALMSDYLKEQEKLVWMLVAYSTCDCKK